MTNSPSNSCTSLSSLGSPGVSRTTSIARKRMYHFADINSCSSIGIGIGNGNVNFNTVGMGSLLSPIQAGSEHQEHEPELFPDLNSNSHNHCSDVHVHADADADADADKRNDNDNDADKDQQIKVLPQTQDCQSSIPTPKSHSLTPNALKENEFDLLSAAYIKILEPPPSPSVQELVEGSPTPTTESQRYLTANESSDDNNDDDDDGEEGGSSGLSYESSSQEDEHEDEDENKDKSEDITSSRQEKESKNNRQQTSSAEKINAKNNDESGESDRELLLSNSDAKTMDLLPLSHIILTSPSDNDFCTSGNGTGTNAKAMSMAMLSSPPKVMPQNRTLEEEEADTITPKRKTNRPSSVNNSPSEINNGAEEAMSGHGGGRRSQLMKSLSLPLSLGGNDDMGAGGGFFAGFAGANASGTGTAIANNIKPRRKRINSVDSKRHRRTRSGDDAAATLLTGSAEWAGMELHNLPLPKDREAYDDDQDEQDLNLLPEYKKDKSSSREREQGHAHGHVNLASRKLQRTRKSRRNVTVSPAGETLVFQSISADDVDLMMDMARSPNALEEGISTRFSPRVAGAAAVKPDPETADMSVTPTTMNDWGSSPPFGPPPGSEIQRSMSFGDASASTVESNFSWISRGTATIAKEAELNNRAKDSGSASPPLNDTRASNILTPPMTNKLRLSTSLLEPMIIARAIPSIEKDIEMQEEQMKKEEFYDEHMRELRNAPPSPTKAPRFQASGKPGEFPTSTCPRCHTVQREFFTVASAGKRFESPAQYIALYFFMYMIMSLFIFGMEVSP